MAEVEVCKYTYPVISIAPVVLFYLYSNTEDVVSPYLQHFVTVIASVGIYVIFQYMSITVFLCLKLYCTQIVLTKGTI